MAVTEIAHITLQSSCGDFDPAFLKRLPALERAMIDRGLDPADFIISKSEAQVTRLTIAYRPTGHPTDYTVFVKGRSFTVTQQDDMSFLRYFYALCLHEPKGDDPHSLEHKLQAPSRSMLAFIDRIGRWLNKPF